MSESRKNKVSMALYYLIIVYIKDLDETQEILVNPKINNELESSNGIYSIISSALDFSEMLNENQIRKFLV